MKSELAALVLAVQFLTRVPLPTGDLWSPQRMAASLRYYPLIGIAIGLLCAGLYWAAQFVFPPIVAVLLSVVLGWLLTGGLHEDGLADTFDGIGGGGTRERALEIMRDSRLGTWGTLALLAAVSLKVAALTDLSAPHAVMAMVAGHGLSRLSCVLVVASSRYARVEGAATPITGVADPASACANVIVACLTGVLIVAVVWSLSGWLPAAAAIAGAAVGHLAMRAVFERRLGGYTGDTLGAVQQASDVGVCLAFLALR